MYPDISIFNYKLNAYDACFVSSLFVVLLLVVLLRPKDFPLKRFNLFRITLFVIFFAVLGAKLLHILFQPPHSFNDFLCSLFNTNGFAYLGAPVLALSFLWVAGRINKVYFLTLADYYASFFMLDRVMGRLGCLLGGCCYGIESRLPWAFKFGGTTTLHPTQAYEIIYALAIFISSRYLYKKSSGVKGLVFFYVVLAYSFLRFFNEFLRADGLTVYGSIKLPHIIFAIFSLVGLWGMMVAIRNSGREKGEVLRNIRASLGKLTLWGIAGGAAILSALSFACKSVK